MQQVNDFLIHLHHYLGGSNWFVILLIGTGVFFTIYLKFPQVRYFKHAIKIVSGKFDKKGDVGDTSHFQALSTALSGTVGTGNIAGVALALHLGGPAALFWMLVTAMLGMTTKFVEVTISHKYRDQLPDGSVSGGPMYYMKKRLNIKLKNGKVIKTGLVLGIFFAIGTVLSSFGTGSLPQINSISNSIFATFGLKHIITGAILAVLLGLVIIGGIKRIAKVTSTLVPLMAIIYFIGALFVIFSNLNNIGPAFLSIFKDVLSPTAATGGFLGGSFAIALSWGVNRGLFSNEAGQGSAPIAHSAARAHEPVSEGMVAILEPFIDTIIICTMTALVITLTGVYTQEGLNGVVMTSAAFKSVVPWFEYVLVIAVFLFAISTMLTWAYYGSRAWRYLFGEHALADNIFKLIFCAFIVIGCSMSLDAVISFSEASIFAMSLINIISLYILAPVVKKEIQGYWTRLKNNEITPVK